MYRCKNGLVDCASPIIIEGEHVANLFIGQFLLETPDRSFFKKQAEQFGFNLDSYMSALDKVPVVDEKRIPLIMRILQEFAQLIASIGLERFKAIEAEKKNRYELKALVKKRTEELDRIVHVLNQAQEVGHIGHWELDLVGNQLSWSDEVYRIFGLQPQEFAATYEAFLEQIHPDDRDMVDQAYSTSVEEKQPYQIIHRVVRSDGETRYVEERGEHSFDEDGNAIRSLGTIHDITENFLAKMALEKLSENLQERVEKEVEHRHRQEQLLIQQSKMASMGEMLGAIAHQLKQPLNSIGIYAQEIDDIIEFEESNEKLLKEITKSVIKQVEHMSRTIDDFRNFFKPSKEKVVFKVCELASEVYHLIEAKMKKANVQFTVHDHECIEIFGLPNEFKQVFLNIYNNSVDVFEERSINERKIDLFSEKSEKIAIIRVQDTGGGIPEELSLTNYLTHISPPKEKKVQVSDFRLVK